MNLHPRVSPVGHRIALWGEMRRTFDCRVVLVEEVVLDHPDGEARFTHTTAADHHQFVFSRNLRPRGISHGYFDGGGERAPAF